MITTLIKTKKHDIFVRITIMVTVLIVRIAIMVVVLIVTPA